MELSRKMGSAGSEPNVAKKMIEFQESERQRRKLEEINLKLRIQLDDQVTIILCQTESIECVFRKRFTV